MSSGNDEAKEDDPESQIGRLQGMSVGMGIEIETRQAVLNQKHLKKSLDILKSALKILTSNTKFMFLIILSILPFFVFMLFFEIKLQKSIIFAASNSAIKSGTLHVMITSNYYDDSNITREFLSDSLQLALFYLFLYPFLELFSMILTMKIEIEVYGAEKPATLSLREMLHHKISLKGPLITYLCVHLMSTMTLLGLLWIVSNQLLVLSRFEFFESLDIILNVLSITVHSVIFLGLFYKYLDWSAFWNMSIVISVTEEQTGIAAFGMSDYYGKHCKKTVFQLMLDFFVFGNVLRLPCVYARLCTGSVAGVLITCIVIMMVSLGNLVKWVAFLLYFQYCKQQTMEKKVDDQEQDKTLNTEDLS